MNGMNLDSVDYTDQDPEQCRPDRGPPRAAARWRPGIRATSTGGSDMGPEGFQEALVYLRTAVSVDPKGWAKFGYVKMPDYRWGILLAPQDEDRKIAFGEHKGEPAWQEVPGEYRAMLRRLIVIQGDTEPASVEQQRHLGTTAPSLYDLRNLFQVNVEEGRHLWAMVYLLHKYFGRDGREEAEELLQPPLRRRRHAAHARRLQRGDAGLAVVLHVHLLHRPRRQDAARRLAQSGFDPLSRTCRFMLTEEAHHMFVGETGVGRIIQRTCEAMKAAGIDDPYDIDAGPRARRDRPADHPEEAQPALFAVARPVRLGDLDQRGQRLQCRPQGPLPGDQDRRRPPADQRDLSGAQAGRRRDQAGRRAGAVRAEHAAARRLHRRLRQAASTAGTGSSRRTGIDFRLDLPHVALQPPDRRVQGRASRRRRASCSTTPPGPRARRLAAVDATTAISSPA